MAARRCAQIPDMSARYLGCQLVHLSDCQLNLPLNPPLEDFSAASPSLRHRIRRSNHRRGINATGQAGGGRAGDANSIKMCSDRQVAWLALGLALQPNSARRSAAKLQLALLCKCPYRSDDDDDDDDVGCHKELHANVIDL